MLGKWVRMRVDLSICKWPRAIPELIEQLREPFETTDTAILMTEGHREHPWHDNLHTPKILRGMLWGGLVNRDNINAKPEIVIDEIREIIVQVQTSRSAVKVAKGLLEGLLLP